MKKSILFAAAITLLASCANDEIVDKAANKDSIVPITLSTNRQNISRAGGTTSLESNLHYNFGVWAQKLKSGSAQTVMENYLVGWSDGSSKGYDKTNATTYETAAGTTADHTSPWFYENLGTKQYTYATTGTGLYTKDDAAYMSANEYQYLRYWDLAYTNTNFYCYSPYQKEGVTISMQNDGKATMTFANSAIRDGYDKTPNTAYASFDRSLAEFMVGGYQATNSALNDITIPFKHMGAQLFIRFHENIPGYKVEILDLSADDGAFTTDATADQKNGIQATPSVKTAGTGGAADTYAVGKYYVKGGATVAFSEAAVPTVTPSYITDDTDADYNNACVSTNLMFYAPSTTATDYSAANIPSGYAANLADFNGLNSTTHHVIKETVTSGTQDYSWSPTIYYPVAQPQSGKTGYQKTGFNFHVTYRIIAEDNKEVITVHNAEVFVPENYTTWASGNRYIYTFQITKNASGTTNPTTEIDPEDPTPSTTKSLYPIVFDACTIEDYVDTNSNHTISDNTQY